MRCACREGILLILLSLLAAFQSTQLFHAVSRSAVMLSSAGRSAKGITIETFLHLKHASMPTAFMKGAYFPYANTL